MAKAKSGSVAGIGKNQKSETRAAYKKTTIGKSRNSRPTNKNKKVNTKPYRGQGR